MSFLPSPVSVRAQEPPNRLLRIAVVQFCPKLGEVDANLARARELCSKLEPHSIDLLCFPEMAFTGYVFDSAESILPYLETPRTGPTSLFCRELATRLGCYVAAGYPESLDSEELLEPTFPGQATQDRHHIPKQAEEFVLPEPSLLSIDAATLDPKAPNYVGANSAILYGPSGDWVGGYRKTNLFETDRSWAKPGTGFASFKLPLPSSSSTSLRLSDHPSDSLSVTSVPALEMSLGICMDLNPQPPAEWTSAEGPYELADHCIKNKSRLLVLLNAWLDPTVTNPEPGEEAEDDAAEDDDGKVNGDDEEPEWTTLNYWCARLQPLWRFDRRRRGSNETIYSNDSTEAEKYELEGEEEEEEEKPPHETIVVACNRTGMENGTTFAGSSAIFSMRAGSGRPKLLDMMGKREEGVRVWNLLI